MFGLIQRDHECNGDLLWMEWSTQDREAPKTGSEVGIRLEIDGTVGQVAADVLATRRIGPITIFVMTNFVVGERLLDLLEHGQTLKVRLIAPAELVEHLDVAEDSFSLVGFSQAREAAHAACLGR
jgi:hypothetical protein